MDPPLLKRVSLPLQEIGSGESAGDARNGEHGQRGGRDSGPGEDEQRPQSEGSGGLGVVDASPWGMVRASSPETGARGGGGSEEKEGGGQPSWQPRFLLGVNVQV
jgi:hypothetical protein